MGLDSFRRVNRPAPTMETFLSVHAPSFNDTGNNDHRSNKIIENCDWALIRARYRRTATVYAIKLYSKVVLCDSRGPDV
jgi:hypothetical protein